MPRAQAYYREIEAIEDLTRAIQFPKLEAPPADFLAQMENYCREAPRPLDEHAHKKVPRLGAPACAYAETSTLACCRSGSWEGMNWQWRAALHGLCWRKALQALRQHGVAKDRQARSNSACI